jgi:hypothetical protein
MKSILGRDLACIVTASLLLLSANAAWADDKSACLAGIKSIKAAINKKPPQPVLERLKQALDNAQQEEIEQDWDECLTAVRQAQLPKR